MLNPFDLDIDETVAFLNRSFSRTAQKAMKKNHWGNNVTRHSNTPLYTYQVDFMYLINDIQRGPIYIVPKLIQNTKDLIARMEVEGL
jgi:hypothetical protein